jgi:hypothetical protein
LHLPSPSWPACGFGAAASVLGRFSLGLGAAIAVGAGLIATILTGEYLASWVYLLADIGSGAIGVAVAMLAVRFVSLRRFIQRRQ